MHIVIPTLRRVRFQTTLAELTTRNIHHHHPITLFCMPDELAPLNERYAQPGVDVKVQRDDVVNIAQLRDQMLEDACERYVLMMDDDLRFYVRKSPDAFNLRNITAGPEGEAEMLAMISMLEDWMKGGFAHVAVSAREGNNRIETAYRHNTRPLRVLGYDREVVLAQGCRFARHGLCDKEDFDMCLQLLTKGFANRVSFHYSQNQRSGSQTNGGCEVYRTHEKMEASSRRLEADWPGLVTAVEKTTKQAWGGGTRIDVRIQWAKAFKQSGGTIPEVA